MAVIFSSRRRIRGRWGGSGPLLRGLGTLGRAVSLVWRRSLQLRVVTLTLGLSLAVILVLMRLFAVPPAQRPRAA